MWGGKGGFRRLSKIMISDLGIKIRFKLIEKAFQIRKFISNFDKILF